MNKTYEEIKQTYLEHGADWDEINIFGVRNENHQEKDIFNDLICVATKGMIYKFQSTCDPGKYWTLIGGANFQSNGVAHICYGFHKKVYKVGKHKGKLALVQRGGKIKIWRDKNKNFKQDKDEKPQEGYFGVNIHRAGFNSLKIGRWSAGCQVIKRDKDFVTFISLIMGSNMYRKNKRTKFNYFLFKDIELRG
jgi:hypothetical protein